MPNGARIADVADVPESGSYLFTAADAFTNEVELVLVRCAEEPGVRAWVNRCTHENQRFDRGSGAPMRNGELICPRHGSFFDACSGECDNGEAAGTTLPGAEIAVEDGAVYLTDDDYTFRHGGPAEEGSTGSSSHLSF